MNNIVLSWSDFGSLVEKLVEKIKKSKEKFDGVYGIPRGGLPLAVILSHKLNIPLILEPTENSLITDDISDTGKTLKKTKHKKIAALFSTDWTSMRPDFFISMKKSKGDWIVFPWEQDKINYSCSGST